MLKRLYLSPLTIPILLKWNKEIIPILPILKILHLMSSPRTTSSYWISLKELNLLESHITYFKKSHIKEPIVLCDICFKTYLQKDSYFVLGA